MEEMGVHFQYILVEILKDYDTKPGSRQQIEEQLEFMMAMRMRVVGIIVRERPDLLLQLQPRRTLRPSPDGSPNLRIRDVLAAVQFTPEQLGKLENSWVKYRESIGNARQELRAAVATAATRAAADVHSYSLHQDPAVAACAGAAAGGYLDLIDAASVLDSHPKREAVELMEFLHVFQMILDPMQRLRVLAMCAPELPDPLQMCVVLFEERESMQATERVTPGS